MSSPITLPHPSHLDMNHDNTMNNYYTMNHDSYDSTRNSYSDDSSSFPIAEAVLSTHAQQQQQQPETSTALYKLAARNLREHHGVPSMTAAKLEKAVALLGLRPRRVVVQGLAPRRLLKDGSSPLFLTGGSSDESLEKLREAETGTALDTSGDNLFNRIINSEDVEGEEVGHADQLFSGDSNNTYDDDGDSIITNNNPNYNNNYGDNGDETKGDVVGLETDGNGNENAKKKRPIHAALVAGGVNLRPRETRPLLRALGVSPRRLVRLGLVKREKVRAKAGRRGGGPGQHLRVGGPGQSGVAGFPVERRGGPPYGPPHAHGGRSPGCGSSRRIHGPPRRLFHGAGHRTTHRREESEEEGMSTPLSPLGGPGYRGRRRHGVRLQGPPHRPGHHSMPTVSHGRGPPGGGKYGYGHGHGHCYGFHSEGEGVGGHRLRGGARGLERHGPRRCGGSISQPRCPPRGPHHADGGCSSGGGPWRRMHGRRRRPFHGGGHHTMHPGEENEEEGMSAPLGPHGGPRHSCLRHHRGGGMSRSRGRPQEPPHGPLHEPFHGLLHEEGTPGAPPSIMAHPRHRSPSRGGGGMKQHGGRNGGGTRFYGGETGFSGGGGGLGGGGGEMQQWWRAHLAHFHGGRHHQPRREAY